MSVSNAVFYQRFRGRARTVLARRALAYNNLLGFPYLHGYSIDTLNKLMARAGFAYVEGFNSELLTTPFADVPASVEQEQQEVSNSVARWSRQAGQQLGYTHGTLDRGGLPNVSRTCHIAPPTDAIDPRFLARAVA